MMRTTSIWLILKLVIILVITVFVLYRRHRRLWYKSEKKESLILLKKQLTDGDISQKQYEELKKIIEIRD